MWITFLIAGAFFVAIVAIGYFGFQEGGWLGTGGEAARPDEAASHAGACGLCNAPLRRAATSDEAVFEIEHRIHDDLRDISHALRASPGGSGGALRA